VWALEIAECPVAAGDRDGDIKGKPTLSGFGAAAEDRQAFRDNVRHGPFGLFEFARYQVGGGDKLNRPDLGLDDVTIKLPEGFLMMSSGIGDLVEHKACTTQPGFDAGGRHLVEPFPLEGRCGRHGARVSRKLGLEVGRIGRDPMGVNLLALRDPEGIHRALEIGSPGHRSPPSGAAGTRKGRRNLSDALIFC